MKNLIASVVAFFLLTAPALAVEPVKPDYGHWAAVSEMLIAARVPELAIAELNKNVVGKREDVTGILGKEEVARVLTPDYAPHMSAAATRQLMGDFHSDTGKNVTALDLARAGAGPAPKLSARERAQVQEFIERPAYREFAAARELAGKRAAETMAVLTERRDGALFLKGLRAVAGNLKSQLDSANGAEPKLLMPEKTGVAKIDQVMALVATTSWRNTHSAWRIDKELTDLGIESVASPENLVTPQGVARSRQILSQVDDKIDMLMRENEATMKTFLADFSAIDLPNKKDMLVGMKRGLERHMEWSVRFVENQRALVDIMKRMVAFADSRMGQIKVKDKTLVMDADADADLYNKLVAEMQDEVARYEKVRGEVVKRVNDVAAGKMPKSK
jgi:hypothetical protein